MAQATATEASTAQNKGSGMGKELCLLSLDGGGVRGLSSLLILKQVMETIDPNDPPKPCEYFDLIGGTSTGGLIALMLGRMRLSIDDCIKAYSKLSPEVFTKVHHRFKLPSGRIQGRFDHKALEVGVKRILTDNGFKEESLLKAPVEVGACRTFVCTTSRETSQTVVLSSYYSARRGTDLYNSTRIWEAARATSAATSFFDSITFEDGEEGFVDGATGANNPIFQLWTEAGDIWGPDLGNSTLEENIRCIVSIGTGIPSITPFGDDPLQIGKALVAIATDTEQQADLFRKHHSKLYQTNRAFRFNVLRGLEGIGLEDASKAKEIKAVTRAYIQSEEVFVQVKACASNLREREWLRSLLEPILRHAHAATISLNKKSNLANSNALLWFTHTNAYAKWSEEPSSVLWYKSRSDAFEKFRENVGASIANMICDRYVPLDQLALKGEKFCRALYFECLDKQDVKSPESSNGPAPLAAKVVRSLVCQAILLDCQVYEHLERKVMSLTEPDRDLLQRGVGLGYGYEIPPAPLFGLLRRIIELSPQPTLIAIDNVGILGTEDVGIVVLNLGDLVHSRKATPPVKLLVSGAPSSDLSSYLRDELHIDDATEFKECVQSLFFQEWNARRTQVADAEVGTNEWIWKHPSYCKWEEEDSGILWIEGKPGSGKSVLAKSIQRAFALALKQRATGLSSSSDRSPSSPRPTLRFLESKAPLLGDYFYSTRLGNLGTAHSYLLRSVLYQLLSHDSSLFDYFLADYRKEKLPIIDASEVWNETVTMDIFKEISAAGVAIVSIIDAMDESKVILPREKGERSVTILSAISKLVSEIPTSNIKFIVLSRPDPFIELDFRQLQHVSAHTHRISLEWENKADIEFIIKRGLALIRAAMQTFDSDEDISPSGTGTSSKKRITRKHKGIQKRSKPFNERDRELERIRTYLVESANGVILWVTLIISELETYASKGMFTYAELESRLAALPTKLDELYSHILHGLIDKLSGDDLAKAHTTLALVSGSQVLGRPIQLRELWDALAVPQDVVAALQSDTDPIATNRIQINSWTGFRRQLRSRCGPLIEVLRSDNIESSQIPTDLEDVGPDQIVQLIHRTVKDFLESQERAGPLYIPEEDAVHKVKDVVDKFSTIAFPRVPTKYAPIVPIRRSSSWREYIREMANYLDERLLLNFALAISSGHEKSFLGPYFLTFNNALEHPINSWTEDRVQAAFSEEVGFYPWSARSSYTLHSARTAIIGHQFWYCCKNGLVTATKNLLILASLEEQVVCPKLSETILNGALLAAIDTDLSDKVDILTRYNRHRGRFVKPEWRSSTLDVDSTDLDPFLRLAVSEGFKEICLKIFNQTAHFCFDQNRLYSRVVTTTDLPGLLEKGDSEEERLREKCLAKCAAAGRKSENLDDFDLENVQESIQIILARYPISTDIQEDDIHDGSSYSDPGKSSLSSEEHDFYNPSMIGRKNTDIHDSTRAPKVGYIEQVVRKEKLRDKIFGRIFSSFRSHSSK